MANSFPHPFGRAALQYRDMRKKLPRETAQTATNFFKESFRKQGFEDKVFIPWKARRGERGRTLGKKRSGRAILVKSGALRRSLRPWSSYDEARVYAGSSKVPYAQIHNEGGMAGRGRKVRIPRRKFMGDSRTLMRELEKDLENKLDKIWKNL